jgi:hypothetical protein
MEALLQHLQSLLIEHHLECALVISSSGDVLAQVGDLEPHDPMGFIASYRDAEEGLAGLFDLLGPPIDVLTFRDGERFAGVCKVGMDRMVVACVSGSDRDYRAAINGLLTLRDHLTE